MVVVAAVVVVVTGHLVRGPGVVMMAVEPATLLLPLGPVEEVSDAPDVEPDLWSRHRLSMRSRSGMLSFACR